MTYHSQEWEHKALAFSLHFVLHLFSGAALQILNVVDKEDKEWLSLNLIKMEIWEFHYLF